MPHPADTLTASRGRQSAGRADTAERRDPSHSRRLDAAPTHQAHHVSHQPHPTRTCPSCSRTHQADMWHLLKAGAAGGDRGVLETVASHPMVFATLTAPLSGAVHASKK